MSRAAGRPVADADPLLQQGWRASTRTAGGARAVRRRAAGDRRGASDWLHIERPGTINPRIIAWISDGR